MPPVSNSISSMLNADNLIALIIDLSGLTDEQVEYVGLQHYKNEYFDAQGNGIQARNGRPVFPNRVYVLYEPAYVIWLEPRGKQNDPVSWKFSTAYPANPKHIRERTKGGSCVWKG